MKKTDDNICIRTERNPEQIHRCMTMLAEVGEVFTHSSQLLSLAGNEVRLKILFLLQLEEKLCVCDLGEILSMKVPAISQHLRKLKDARMVTTQREGVTIYYFLHPKRLANIKTMLSLVTEIAVL